MSFYNFFALILLQVFSVQSYNDDLPYSVLSNCKEFQIEGNYHYREPFNISSMENNKPFKNEIFRLKFYVFTTNDAHLLITNLPKVQINEPGYEIVFGGDKNTESVIKVHRLGKPVVFKYGAITSPLYPTEFIISLREDGLLTVDLPDYDRPYMSYKDSSPKFWTYFALSAWYDTEARWFYDCPIGKDGM